MTKRERFNLIATVNADNAEIVDFCAHEVELLDAHKSSKRGMTATQKANVAVKDAIVEALSTIGNATTVTDLIATSDALAGFTNQKVSALLRQLIEEKKVVKTIEGKKALFSLA